jgi:2Fe-2S ferredoxin
MTTIYITENDGTTHTVDAKDGLSVMEVLRPLDIGIEGECEGSLACATCHVWVDEGWMGKVGEKSEEEEDMLDTAFMVRNTSRLCCQITVAAELDGLKVAVPHR